MPLIRAQVANLSSRWLSDQSDETDHACNSLMEAAGILAHHPTFTACESPSHFWKFFRRDNFDQ